MKAKLPPASKFSRRQLLASLGGAAAFNALGPFVPRLAADTIATPKRFFYFATGTAQQATAVDQYYYPNPGPLALGAKSPFLALTAPERKLTPRLAILRGIASRTTGNVGPHPELCQTLSGWGWRKTNAGEQEFVQGSTMDGDATSVDQHLAYQIQSSSPVAIRSIEAGIANVADFRGPATASISYYQRRIVPRLQNPQDLFDKIFGIVGKAPGNTGPSPQVAERLSVLDFALQSVKQLKQRLGREDSDRLDAHLQAISELEATLNPQVGSNGNAACQNLTAPGAKLSPPDAVAAFGKLIAVAMACDLTRVAGIQIGVPTDTLKYEWVAPLAGFANYHNATHTSSANAIAYADKVNAWRAQTFATILGFLDGYAEGDGTLLDNTLALWTQDTDRAHDESNHWFCMLAGAKGYLRGGQLYDFKQKVALNAVLANVCDFMGYPVDGWGAAAARGTGKLTEILA